MAGNIQCILHNNLHTGNLYVDKLMLMFTVRLIGGPSIREGRLEVLQRDTWGSVCRIDSDAAKVVCSSLGFGYALMLSAIVTALQ